MFTDIRGAGKLVLIGCSKCSLGEMMPRHPTWRAVDLYHFILDNVSKGKIPEFHYPKLTGDDYEYLRENVTLGKIVCNLVIEEGE